MMVACHKKAETHVREEERRCQSKYLSVIPCTTRYLEIYSEMMAHADETHDRGKSSYLKRLLDVLYVRALS